MNLLQGKKTYLSGLALLGLGVAQLVVMKDPVSAGQSIMAGLGLIFARQAVSRVEAPK